MKKVLVSGGSGAIGFAIAQKFLDEGFYVILQASSLSSAAKVAMRLEGHKGSFEVFVLEAGKMEEDYCLPSQFTNVDILVNAVGGGGAHESWNNTTIDKWREIYNLNVVLPVFLIRRVLPYMQKMQFGRVINIASISALKALEIGPEYSSAKAGLVSLTESLAKECACSGITVNSVSPGLVLTDEVREFIIHKFNLAEHATEQELQEVVSREFFPNLIGKIPLPVEIAETVFFLSSSVASKITGQNIVIDSGYLYSDYVKSSVK